MRIEISFTTSPSLFIYPTEKKNNEKFYSMKLKVKCHSCLGFSVKSRITYFMKILELENMHIAFTDMHLMKKKFFY